MSEADARRVLNAHGFQNVEVSKTRFWMTSAGKCHGEAAQFEGTAHARNGERVFVVACVTWPGSGGWASSQGKCLVQGNNLVME